MPAHVTCPCFNGAGNSVIYLGIPQCKPRIGRFGYAEKAESEELYKEEHELEYYQAKQSSAVAPTESQESVNAEAVQAETILQHDHG